MKNFKYGAAFFDLDGTLADNYTAIWATLRDAFLEENLPPPTYETVYRAVGGSIKITIEKLMPSPDSVLVERLGTRYMQINKLRVFDGLKPMPFARETLAALRTKGLRLALFTNKNEEAAVSIVDRLGFGVYLDCVCATSLNSHRKPSSEFTISALKKLGVSAGESVFVGDSPYDFQAAKNGGSDCALVATGADSAETLARECSGSLGVFKNLRQLSKAIFDVEV